MNNTLFPSPIQVLHLRYSYVKYHNIHVNPKGGMTVAYQVHNYPEHEKIGVVIATTRCRDDELYNRKIGRELAVERLKAFPIQDYDPTRTILDIALPTKLHVVPYSILETEIVSNGGIELANGEILKTLREEEHVALALMEKHSQFSEQIVRIVNSTYKTKARPWTPIYIGDPAY